MATTLEASINCKLSAVFVNTLTNGLAPVSVDMTGQGLTTFTDGTTANKADRLWGSKGRALTGTTPEDIDVYDFGSIDIGAGAGLDPHGQAITLAEITALMVINNTSSTGTLAIGGKGTGAAWNSWIQADDDAAVTLKPGGVFLITSPTDPGFAVADTSNHLLTMTPTDDLTYDIYIVGRSA